MHPRPPGRHIEIDSYQLILSFELKFFVCQHVSIWGFLNRVCLYIRPSVCPYPECQYPEKRNHPGFVNISPTLVYIIDTSMKRSSRVLQHGNPKIWIFFKKVRYWILSVPRESVPQKINHPGFVNITLYQPYSCISNW